MSSDEERLFITQEQAENLLEDSDTVHNFVQFGHFFLGCDFSRGGAIKAFKEAKSIEIGGPSCKAARHPIVVFDQDGRYSFFEADMAKVEDFEARARLMISASAAIASAEGRR